MPLFVRIPMAKPRVKNEPAPEELSRKHRRLLQQEQEKQKRLLLAIGAVVGLVLVVLLAGAINEFAVKPRRAVAVVNGESISLAAFQRRMRFAEDNLVSQINQYIQFGQQFASADGSNPFAQTIQQLAGELSSPETLSLNLLDSMIEEKLVAQLASKQGVSVSDDEVQQQIEKDFGYERNPTPTPTPDPTTPVTNTVTNTAPAMTVAEFQKNYSNAITQLQDRKSVNEAEFRETYHNRLLRQKLQDAAPLDVKTTEEQVHARHILIRFPEAGQDKTQAQADVEALTKIQEIRKRIEGGEKFEDVAKQVSDDVSNKDQGGDLGWFGRGRMVKEFEDAAFALEPGKLSQPIKTSFGYHLILVIEKDPNRAVDANELSQRRSQAFTDWLKAQQDAAAIERKWSSDLAPALPDDIRSFLNNLAGALAASQPAPAPASETPTAPTATPAP